MDHIDAEQLISTMVDDVFFVIQKCTRRSLSTQQPDCVCALLNHANAILEEDFATAMVSIFQDNCSLCAYMGFLFLYCERCFWLLEVYKLQDCLCVL